MSPCCLGGWILIVAELAGAIAQATRQLTSRAASHEAPLTCLLEHPSWRLASSVAHVWSSTARQWLVACAKLVGTAAVASTLLFLIEVIDDRAWRVAPARSLPRSRLPYGRLLLVFYAAARLNSG